ncbi:MAG: NAD-dependent epimerase/dehydratase family protein, partial [Oscillospiraceae bacterium]|nr:NAD-dependent epimerase/dehydratase family protein [Oscillospiraceae bacterium]
EYDGDVDFILHTASVTASKSFVTEPVQTLMTAIDGTKNLLEFAREKQVQSMVYVSSMEAYGITDPALERVTEKDLGYIDILSVRSSYSEGKRICECLCAAYAAQYGVPVKIARLAQTFGAGVSRADGRVFAQFTKSCLEGRDIVLHTAGKSMGNYCYTADAVRGLLTIALRGENANAYTVVNPATSMQIRQVAQLVSDTLTKGQTKIIFDIPESSLTYGYAPDVTMRLSGDKLMQLGWHPEVDLPDMFRRLAASFQAQEDA